MITFYDGPFIKDILLEEGDYVNNLKIKKLIHQFYSNNKEIVADGAFLLITFIDSDNNFQSLRIHDANKDLRDHVKAVGSSYFKRMTDYPFKRTSPIKCI